jgi:hypothetical protein
MGQQFEFMKKLFAFAAVLALGYVSQAAMIGDMRNQSFENGFTGWTTPVSGANFSATTLYAPFNLPAYNNLPTDSAGHWFATLDKIAGSAGSRSIVQANINLSPGEAIYGWYAYDANGAAGERFDILINGLTDGFLPVNANPVSGINSDVTSWTYWSYTPSLTDGGTYALTYRVTTTGTAAGGVALFDMSAIPEARGWMMGGMLVLVLGAVELLRRRRQQTA